MLQCRLCRYVMGDSEEAIGSRCPRCRQPLYERPEGMPGGPPEPDPQTSGRCAVHTSRASLGNCVQCGKAMCRVCRSRWNNQPTCTACVEKSLQRKEGRVEE